MVCFFVVCFVYFWCPVCMLICGWDIPRKSPSVSVWPSLVGITPRGAPWWLCACHTT